MINKIWTEEFGDEYHERNAITPELLEARQKMWFNHLLTIWNCTNCIPNSICEIGAGNGINMLALKKCIDDMKMPYELYAIEPNETARKMIKDHHQPSIGVYDAQLPDITIFNPGTFGLVFTSGVLIHIPRNDLLASMRTIYDLSSRFIICIEYFASEEREVNYRGHDGALWADDYGSKWLDNFPLRCFGFGFLWKRMTGLDNMTFWIFEKVN